MADELFIDQLRPDDSKTNVTSSTQKTASIAERIKLMYHTVSVEVILVLYILPSIAASLATQNISIEKACRINLGLNETICNGIISQNSSLYHETDDIQVQKLIASMYAWRDFAQSIFPAILLLFFGSWSDRHHVRKPCFLLPLIGSAVSSIGYIICTYFFYELPAEYCMLSDALPIALTGNWFLFNLGVFSYVSDISSLENRTVRLGAITTLFNVCATAGLGASGFVYSLIGYYGVFLSSLVLYIVAFLYGWFAVKETYVTKHNDKGTQMGFLRDFFNTENITDTFKIVFKNPNPKKKKRMLIIMILVAVISGPWYGEAAVLYLFVRYRFQWNEIDYSIFSFYGSILHTIATIFSLSFFSKYLQMDDALMGVMSSMSKILSSFIYFFATSGLPFYLGAVIEVFNGTSYIAMRSIISKLVSADELGKVNSLFGLCEALMPLVYGPMYSLVYKWTIDFIPGAFFLFGAALTIPGVVIFLWLYQEHKRDKLEEKKDEVQKEELLQIKQSDDRI